MVDQTSTPDPPPDPLPPSSSPAPTATLVESAAAKTISENDKANRQHILEAYFSANEIIYNWAKLLDEYQAKGVGAMCNVYSLTNSAHPLCLPGQDATSIFLGSQHDGRKRLMFSLKQVQYIAYYVCQQRLGDPAYHAYLEAFQKWDSSKEGDMPTEPPVDDDSYQPVPLPGSLLFPSAFEDIVRVNIRARAIKKALKQYQKANKAIEARLLKMQPELLTRDERLGAEVAEDNSREGPGLSRGPRRVKEQKPEQAPRVEGTGWGGFPISKDDGQVAIPDGDIPWQQAEPQNEGETGVIPERTSTVDRQIEDDSEVLKADTTVPQKDRADVTANESDDNARVGETDPSAAPRLAPPPLEVEDHGSTDGSEAVMEADEAVSLASKMSALADLMHKFPTAETAASPPPSVNPTPSDPSTPAGLDGAFRANDSVIDDAFEQYHYDAQQAFALAANGGLKNALEEQRAASGPSSSPAVTDNDSSAFDNIDPSIGRSLFVALRLTTWEQDENVVLEAGWAATWFQESLDEGEGKGEGGGKSFEQASEHGHIIVQDHLLDKHNGSVKPNNRQNFQFGKSIPLPSSKVVHVLQNKLQILAQKAGGGPIYFLIHSADAELDDFKKLGWQLHHIFTNLRPDGWEYPSYASENGVGEGFVIDTARLFGAIGNDLSVRPALGKTRKSLEQVAIKMFGGPDGQMPHDFGNAGNDAGYCLKVFVAIVTGLPLESLRIEYEMTELQAALDAQTTDSHNIEPASLPATIFPTSQAPGDGAHVANGEAFSGHVDAQDATGTTSVEAPILSAASTAATLIASDPLEHGPASQGMTGEASEATAEDDGDDSNDDEPEIQAVYVRNDAGEDVPLVDL